MRTVGVPQSFNTTCQSVVIVPLRAARPKISIHLNSGICVRFAFKKSNSVEVHYIAGKQRV